MSQHDGGQHLRGLELISDEQWNFYRDVIDAAEETGRPFALGGAFAWATYTGLYRNTKDLDLYVLPTDHQKFVDAVTQAGASDYFDTLPYDRGWIYRSTRDGFIADIIWAMANYRFPIDHDYVERGPLLHIRGKQVRVIPAEELILNKCYIVQRGRCDYFDIFNVLYCTDGNLDWDRLIRKMGPDTPLLASVLNIFAWLCPGLVQRNFSKDIWPRVGLEVPREEGPDVDEERVTLLDSRPWFLPTLKPGQQIFVDKK